MESKLLFSLTWIATTRSSLQMSLFTCHKYGPITVGIVWQDVKHIYLDFVSSFIFTRHFQKSTFDLFNLNQFLNDFFEMYTMIFFNTTTGLKTPHQPFTFC